MRPPITLGAGSANRAFAADRPDRLRDADATLVCTLAGSIFAIMLEVWSRWIVGWAIGVQVTTDCMLYALNSMAAAFLFSSPRRGAIGAG